jgi:hypothetical protein
MTPMAQETPNRSASTPARSVIHRCIDLEPLVGKPFLEEGQYLQIIVDQ